MRKLLLSYASSAYRLLDKFTNHLQSPFLLAVRLYWGWQFAQSGWGKLHSIPRVTDFFASLNIPFPYANAVLVSNLEFFGGILLIRRGACGGLLRLENPSIHAFELFIGAHIGFLQARGHDIE